MAEKVLCPGCGREIGSFVEIERDTFLMIDNRLVTNYRSICMNCQEVYSWYQNEARLAKLISRIQNRDNSYLKQ